MAVVGHRIVIQAHLLAQRFRIQRPAFGVGSAVRVLGAELAEVRQVQLLEQGGVQMVARHAFVQEQADHVDAAVFLRIVDHWPEHAGMRAVGGRRRIVVGRGGAGQLRLQVQFQLRLWNQAEVGRQLGLHLRVDGAVRVQHLLVGAEDVEPGLRADPLRQLFLGPVKAQLGAEQRQLLLDARDLLQAQCVDLVGGQRQVGAVLDAGRVPGGAIRQRAPAGAGAAGWQIFVLQEIDQARQRRRDALVHRSQIAGGQLEARHRRIVDAGFRRGRTQVLELRQHGHGDRLRLHHAAAHAFLHVGDGLVDPRRQLVQAAQVRLVLLHRLQRLRAGAAGVIGQRAGHVVELVQRQQMLGEGFQLHRVVELVGQQVIGQLILRAELVAVHRHQLLLHRAVQRELRGAHLGRNRQTELVVVAAVAVGRGEQERIELAARRVKGRRDPGQLLLRLPGLGRRHRRLRLHRQRVSTRQHQAGNQNGSTQTKHKFPQMCDGE
ncbi:conserved hypothetical protein [Ricinus communis]|uniref:Uncharacterized protein n=1 Tax=Ricinus communis TaxID=3988 RepID=B9TBJ6_RICCO|nr:conserved hypothetical protein [Ricinus communis]